MADFSREAATIEEVYIRVPKRDGSDEYLRRPYNLVTYDNGEQYVEPVSITGTPHAYGDLSFPAVSTKILIVDQDPYVGLTEIR